MITEAIFDILLAPVMLLVNAMPSFTFAIPDVAFGPLVSVVNTLGYIVPIKALLPILVASSILTTGQIAWAFLLRVKSFIPTMGN